MTTFAQHRAAFEFFLDCVQGGAGKDAIAGCLAENVVLIGPLSNEPLTGREAVAEAIQTVHTLAADLTYEEVLSGETHHAAFFRLQIEDTVVNGMDYALLDADGKIAEVNHILAPAAVRRRDAGAPCACPRHAALGTAHKRRVTIMDALVPCLNLHKRDKAKAREQGREHAS